MGHWCLFFNSLQEVIVSGYHMTHEFLYCTFIIMYITACVVYCNNYTTQDGSLVSSSSLAVSCYWSARGGVGGGGGRRTSRLDDDYKASDREECSDNVWQRGPAE